MAEDEGLNLDRLREGLQRAKADAGRYDPLVESPDFGGERVIGEIVGTRAPGEFPYDVVEAARRDRAFESDRAGKEVEESGGRSRADVQEPR